MSDFKDLTADDFAEPAKPLPAGTNPATKQPFTTAEVKREVFGPPSVAAGIEPNWLKRGLAGVGLGFVDKMRGVVGLPAAEDYGLREDTVGGLGAMVPEAAASMTAPSRVLPQALFGAVSRGMDPAPNAMERGVNALKGAAELGGGQAVASGLVRGANSLAGNLSREGQVASAARRQGLDLSAGDMLDSKLMRLAEEKSFASPSGVQAEQVASLMADPKNNPLRNAIFNAYDAAQTKVSDASTRLDDILANTPGMPKVTPRNTYDALKTIAARSPKTLDAVGDPQLRQVIDSIIATPNGRIPKGMTFSQLDELRRTFGPIMAKIEMQSKSGASNINTADSNRWKQLYKSIMEDIDDWGSSKMTAEAKAAHDELRNTFKNEVLPLREHPVAGKVLVDGYERPEDLVRDLALSQRNTTINKQLYERLDQGGKNALDAFRLAGRGSREFVRGEPQTTWARPLAMSAGLTAPAWAPYASSVLPWAAGAVAAEQALVHGLNSRVGKAIISGAPEASRSPLLDAAIQAGLRTSLPGALTEMRR